MAEAIRERRGSSFYLSEDTFDGVPIPIWFISESVAVVGKNLGEIRGVIDENRDLSQVTAVVKLVKKPASRHLGCRRIQL
jgi:hypothetical protein